MQFTQKSKEHIDSCRFCWMCHHVCPIGIATGQERNTPRARALGLSLVARGAIEYTDDIINNVYECSLCGACMTDCVTGWDPVMFTREARLGAALDGKLPDYVMKMIENLGAKGNIYGVDSAVEYEERTEGDVLFYIGEDARAKGDARDAIKLLDLAGVKFSVLKKEPDSGYSMSFLVGAANETKSVMEECCKVLNGYKTVICYNPTDAKVMKREYKEWGIDLKAEVVTFTEKLASLIYEGALKPKKTDKAFTPQDSPLLARDLEEIEPIRKVLSACGEICEMLLCKEHTQLAGNLIMNEYMGGVIEKVASERWNNARNIGAKNLVVAEAAEYFMLDKTKPENMELYKLEEVVLSCL